MALLMVLYPLSRWPIEAIRSDEPSILLGMSWAQSISVVLLAAGLGCAGALATPSGDRPSCPLSPRLADRFGRVEDSMKMTGDYLR